MHRCLLKLKTNCIEMLQTYLFLKLSISIQKVQCPKSKDCLKIGNYITSFSLENCSDIKCKLISETCLQNNFASSHLMHSQIMSEKRLKLRN